LLDIIGAIILGAVQGVSEFLPISSSGHLAIVQSLMGVDPGLAFDTILHIGTLVAVFMFFWNDIISILKGFIRSLGDIPNGNFMNEIMKDKDKKYAWLIIIGSIPTAIIGILLKSAVESVLSGTLYVGIFLLVTGALLYYSEKSPSGKTDIKDMSIKQSLIIGTCQGISVFPGISRSGSTIASGLFEGLEREFAARYSFLLSIPAILGALLVQVKDIAVIDISAGVIIAGFVSSVIFGYLSVRLLMKMIKGWSLNIFAYYCWIVGILTIILTVAFGAI
jgi:undecaprenyl-diphosphatase